MLAHQDLEEAVGDELVEGEELAVGGCCGFGVGGRNGAAAGAESGDGFGDDGVGDGFAGHFPESDKAVDGGREADGEDAVVAGGAGRLVVEIEGAGVVVGAEEDKDVEPVEGIDEADGDIDVVLEAVAVVDVEVPELAGQQRAGEGGAGGGAPHELMEIFGVEADHFGVGEEAGGDEGEHGVAGGEEDFGLGLEGLGFEAMAECWAAGGGGEGDVGFAGGVEAVGVPAEGVGFNDGALDVVAERAGPIDGELGAECVADADGVGDAPSGVGADLGGFGGGAGGPDGVVESFCCDHGAGEAVLAEGGGDAGDDFLLAILAEGFGGDDVGIVGAPVGDADFGVLADDFFEGDGLARGGVEEGLAFIGGGPLRAGDEVFAPGLR